MKYLIKSLKWTKNDGIETWWKPNSCGYTTLIADAGIYTEEDKTRMADGIKRRIVMFIPLTQELIKEGEKQLVEEIARNDDEIGIQKVIYENAIKQHNEKASSIDKKYETLFNMKIQIAL